MGKELSVMTYGHVRRQLQASAIAVAATDLGVALHKDLAALLEKMCLMLKKMLLAKSALAQE